MDHRQLREEGALLVASTIVAALAVRILLYLAPGVGGTQIAGVHVHHLLSGIVLIVLGGVPAVLLQSRSVLRSASVVGFGSGLGLALDEWLLFVVRESNPETPYMSAVSLLGAAVIVSLASAYALLVCALMRSGRARETTGH